MLADNCRTNICSVIMILVMRLICIWYSNLGETEMMIERETQPNDSIAQHSAHTFKFL